MNLSVREFRREWARLSTELIRVTSNRREIGFWVPIGSDEWRLINDALKENSSNEKSPFEPSTSFGVSIDPRDL